MPNIIRASGILVMQVLLTHSTVSGYFYKIYILSNKICVAMGHLFIFLCELIIILEFLLPWKMVGFFSEPTNIFWSNLRILLILYEKKANIWDKSVQAVIQAIAIINCMFGICDKIQFCLFIILQFIISSPLSLGAIILYSPFSLPTS